MRLDNYLLQIKMFDSRTKAKQAIERNEIIINGKIINKVSFDVDENKNYDIKRVFESSFVSLGGFKLEKALNDFNFIVKNLVCADIGSSTGGFTDCLLQRGAKTVFAVDLNDDLLHDSLKDNCKVKPIIKNAKDLTLNDFNTSLDLIVADLSFISINHVIHVFDSLLENEKHLIILIKPQFETGVRKKFKNGIIKDKKLQSEICKNVYNKALENNLIPLSITTAPIQESKNVEFLMLLKKGDGNKFDISQIDKL